MTFTFASPVTVGTYPAQLSVSAVRLAAISFNFEAAKSGASAPVCAASFVLEDPVSGYRFANPQFSDAASLALVRSILAATNPATGHTFESDILARAVKATDAASGKTLVPSGTAA